MFYRSYICLMSDGDVILLLTQKIFFFISRESRSTRKQTIILQLTSYISNDYGYSNTSDTYILKLFVYLTIRYEFV